MEEEQNSYLEELIKERDSIDPSLTNVIRFVNQEIEKLQNGADLNENGQPDDKPTKSELVEVLKPKPIKLRIKVNVPVKEHPNFNFVGKLLGPKGLSLKRLQEETMTRMAILGKGSMRDKAKEEELRTGPDPKYHHLNEELHVVINAYAPPSDAYARMAHAIEGVKKYLVPDYFDDVRTQQFQELAVMNGGHPRGGGGPSRPPMKRGMPPMGPRNTNQGQWVSLAATPPQRTSTPRGRGRGGSPRNPRGVQAHGRGIRGRGGAGPRSMEYGYEEQNFGGEEQYDESYGQGQNASGDGGYYGYNTSVTDDGFQDNQDYTQDYTEDWNPPETNGRAKKDQTGGPIRRGGARGGFRSQPYGQSFGNRF